MAHVCASERPQLPSLTSSSSIKSSPSLRKSWPPNTPGRSPHIVTNKKPIPLIRNNFVSRKLEVGLAAERQRLVGMKSACSRHFIGEGLEQVLDETLLDVLDDEDETRAVIAIRPSRQSDRRMKDMLDAMQHDGTRRIIGDLHDALHAQHVGAVE